MGMMNTYTGKTIDIPIVRPVDIDIVDIAHSLALQCRFNGHTEKFYSVAEHSVRVANLLENDGADLTTVLIGLMHDASEAYTGDIVKGWKSELRGFKEMENRITGNIFSWFGISGGDWAKVKDADEILLATEGRDLMNNTYGWNLQMQPLKEVILPVEWREAEELFMFKWEVLRGIRSK